MEVKLYNQKAEAIGQAELPARVFGVAMNTDLVHQAATAQAANARRVIAHTKDRSEARGGGRKPWRQKGTGRARHGSIRSPIWKGGGVTFGPTKERNFAKKINKKMRRKALFMALSAKLKDEELVLVDKLELKEAKTRQMAAVLSGFDKLKKGLSSSALIVLPVHRSLGEGGAGANANIVRAAGNLPKVKTVRADSLNILDILSHKYLVLCQKAVPVIEEKYHG